MKYFLIILSFFLASCHESRFASFSIDQNLTKLASFPKQRLFDENSYKASFFKPWGAFLSENKELELDFDKKIKTYLSKNYKSQVFWFKSSFKEQFYFYNHHKIPASFFTKTMSDANEESFLSLNLAAILKKNTKLLILPTKRQLFKDTFSQGEGVPFDYNLIGVLNYSSPIRLSHYSKDRSFAFVQSQLGWGFVDARALFFIKPKWSKSYARGSFITPIKDDIAVLDTDKDFIFRARIGAIYGINHEDESNFYSQIANKRLVFKKSSFKRFPLFFSKQNFELLTRPLQNKPYGWGGYAYDRDCSSFLKDIFASFGIFLPRNSKSQALNYPNTNISKLSPKKKLDFIKQSAIPYLTLLYMPGHIMLYVGFKDSKALALHEAWGMKISEKKRLFIGHLAISALDSKEGFEYLPDSSLYINKIERVVFLR